MTEIKRISFSELKNWKECPYRHKLIYIDKLPHFEGNEYTAFGTAIHNVCEETIPDAKEDSENTKGVLALSRFRPASSCAQEHLSGG